MSTGGNGAPKRSKVEALKLESQYLKLPLIDEVNADGASVGEQAMQILKFHGSYQQDDRDTRVQLRREGQEPAYSFMVRVRIPGGRIDARQYLACDELSRAVGNETLRITTRQEFQLHGILKQDLKSTIRKVNETLLDTLAACGDVERNVLCCPAPVHDAVHAEMQEDCARLAAHFAPRSSSYWDIWLDGEKIDNPDAPRPQPALVPTAGDDAVEPLYGKTYMPRKFKTAFALPDDNCTDVYANDLGYIAVVEGGHVVGYNVVVGGGMGTTPSAKKTFPAVAVDLCYVPRPEALRVGEAVLKVQRDFGDRGDRKRARLKYVIYDWGIDAFKAKVEEYLGEPLTPPRDLPITEVDDHLGWHEQGDGNWFLGIPVENGRVKDEGDLRLASGLRAYFERFGSPARLTCLQSIILTDIPPDRKDEVNAWLEEYGIASAEETSTVRRWAMACPALPTCGLAVTESERVLPAVMGQFEEAMARLGLEEERYSVHMTGCPNGCARPYNCDIGLVGRGASKNPDGSPGPGTYTIFLGGRVQGDRLNVVYKDYVPLERIVDELVPVFTRFKVERGPGESFGDYCHRVGVEALAAEGAEA
ncbi:NADPH-dependent assimilatory sulfite reductase hemoprotein subunit [Tautonia plasticadhaerens]|uniref:Sulfite reductase [ferredoxin] n=1 Tax=Tautonia plasticadhaerens TaxID=2527974 RepID=A0A518H120_9BACT|nr:NADPH-dependent assimilatory sulfite reductase hemoprotein subunit [Tautonia plasticadhaerens]QDV34545.1 Sulfite reductase [ferredoxin] [Tautonia plasticadhaerens]